MVRCYFRFSSISTILSLKEIKTIFILLKVVVASYMVIFSIHNETIIGDYRTTLCFLVKVFAYPAACQ